MIAETEIILDKVDLGILRLMQENARITNADLARELNMAPSAVLERVKKLEQKKVILQYTTRLNPGILHQKLLAFVFMKAADGLGCGYHPSIKTHQKMADLLVDELATRLGW